MNPVTEAILHQIETLGYTVNMDGNRRVVKIEAIPTGIGEKKVIRYESAEGEDAVYMAACRLAEAVGIELEDG